MSDDKIPINEVKTLSSEGRTEREIIHELKSKGHSNENISKALSAVIKDSVTQQAEQRPTIQPRNIVSVNQATFALPPQPSLPVAEDMKEPPMEYESSQQSIPMNMEEEIQLEELIEEILNEKWEELRGNLAEWDRSISVLMEKMRQMEDRMKDLENRHDSVREDIKEMMGSTSENLQIVQGRVGSIEKVFKEFMPSLTDSMRSLSTSVEKMDKKKKN